MDRLYGFFLITSVVLVSSCQRDCFESDDPQSKGLIFSASIADATTKTTIYKDEGVYKIFWESSDSISINGVVYSVMPSSKDPSVATLCKKRESDEDPKAPYVAYYPATLYDSISHTAKLPSVQFYKAEDCVAGINPMYAHSETSTNLQFSNLCGMMRFTLKGTETIGQITIVDSAKALSGKFTVNEDNAAVLAETASGAVTLDCGSGVTLNNEGKVFYVAVPAGIYGKMAIKYSTLNNVKVCDMKANATAVIGRNSVYPFEVSPVFKEDWLCFTAVEPNVKVSMVFTPRDIEPIPIDIALLYSTDGNTWKTFVEGSDTAVVNLQNAGDKVYLKAKNFNSHFASRLPELETHHFTTTGKVTVSGNIMYLLHGTTPSTIFTNDCTFGHIFYRCQIVDAKGLELPAKVLIRNCYEGLFESCSLLTAAPVLPATTLAPSCYAAMFLECKSLKIAPELPAMVMTKDCYTEMFENCGSLEVAPELPATILAEGCYMGMFNKCRSLSIAPKLPAETLVQKCYLGMFMNCSKLSQVTMLATNTNAFYPINEWLDGAGSAATSRTLIVAKGMSTDTTITNHTPANWTITEKVK